MPVENSSSNLIILYGGFLTSAKILIVLYPGDKLLAPVMYLRKKKQVNIVRPPVFLRGRDGTFQKLLKEGSEIC